METTPQPVTFYAMIQRIFSLALPMAGTQFINIASSFLCMAMLAQLGQETLAASALIFSTQAAIMVTGMSIIFALSVLISRAYGANDYLTVGNYLQQGWVVALLLSIPMMMLFWHSGTILIALGQTPAVAHIVQNYFHTFTFAVIPGLLSTCNQQFGYGIHKKLLMIFTSICSVSILLITAYTLIFGKFGLPKLGVAGLGYALCAQYSFFLLFTTTFFYFEKSFHRFEIFRFRVHQHLEHLSKMFKIGWPISVQMGGEMLSLLANATMVGWLGTTALGAFQVVNQYSFLILIPIFSLSQASGILIGHACGAKKFHEVKKMGYASLMLTLMITSCVAFLFLFFPTWLARFYINVDDPHQATTVHLIILLFAVIAFSQIVDGIRNVLVGILRGLLDTKFPMYTGLLVIWGIGIPLSYYLAFVLHWGVVGIALGGLFGVSIGAAAMLYRWHHHASF